ncbi:MAG: radical SAM protein [Thermoplasmata archaeon]|nr:radical SAM protein [Thermoplasmata archaeon]
MKLLLVYPPFCPPTVPPHSITYLASFISANSNTEVKCLDLNAKFHRLRFPDIYRRLEKARESINPYSEMLEKYSSSAKKVHRKNNLRLSEGEEPELFQELLEMILREKTDAVGVSMVYNSQVFYGLRLIEELNKAGIRCVAGGPAAVGFVEEKVEVLKDGAELLKYLAGKEKCTDIYAPDYSHYPASDYLSKEMIYPLRSSYGCSHRGCAFCTHHGSVPYRKINVEEIESAIVKNGMRNLFFIDDNIPAERLSELAEMLRPLKVKWWCQTRPTEDLLGMFPKLKESGLTAVSFGVESGNQRILDSMRKGTDAETVGMVLEESHAAGIRNIVFMMFGFPGEDEDSFMETMEFLRKNRKNIDIVSASVFGLQKGSYVHDHPDEFGVFGIREYTTPLGESIGYRVRAGLGEKQAKVMKEGFSRELREMNQLPKIFCLLKEQSLFF